MASEKQRFGAHMSIAGGLHNAFDAGMRAGCDCLQIFVKNQRQWKAPPLKDEHISAYREAEKRTGLTPVVAHATYLINLASPDSAARAKSVDALLDELTRCEALAVPFLVVHPGAHVGSGEEAGMTAIARSLDEVHQRAAGFGSQIALECTAGQGSTLGWQMSQLGRIISQVREAHRVRVCLDTCHLFAAGYDLRDAEAYEKMIDEIKTHFGLDRLCCIHMNDSKTPCGKRVDRHDHIGKGHIGQQGFERILNDPRLSALPKILETPKEEDESGTDMDIVNLNLLRRWIRP